MNRIQSILLLLALVVAGTYSPLGSSVACAQEASPKLAAAWENYWRGRYAEAETLFTALKVGDTSDPESDADSSQAQQALGLAACQWDTGKLEEALKTLSAAIESSQRRDTDKDATAANHDSAALHARRAQYTFQQGNYETAAADVSAALKANKTNLEARWLDAELNRVTGKLDEALKGYEWFLDHYRAHPKFASGDEIRWTCLAAAQYARWKRNSRQFNTIVNSFLPDAIKLNEYYWPARLESGYIFLEKFNRPQAKVDFDKALAINLRSAEIHVARAQLALMQYELEDAAESLARARETNPNLLDLHLCQADWHFAGFQPHAAVEVLTAAQKLNPKSEALMGRLAAAHMAVDGELSDDPKTEAGKIIATAEANNKNCGEFYLAMADSFDRLRRYPLAVKYYELAVDRMPQLVGARGKLGMVQMRLGDEATARKLLDESFDIDPFNVRVKNSLSVLKILDKYETITTDHFIIRYDPADTILAQQMAEFLEEHAYPEVTQSLGYEPKQKSLIEIFRTSGRTSGHGWFSARMVGLPYVGTVAACAGRAVAMASPNEIPSKYHWANVIKHEFVHVVNMEQTAFAIPHWYTEALAVSHEGHPREESWNRVLLKRHTADTLFDLETINSGFIRPQSSDDWTLAYCQAELYAEYMVSRFGETAHAKMLAEYAKQSPTDVAIQAAFGITQEDFENGFKDYVDKVVAEIKLGPPAKFSSLPDLRKAAADAPEDVDLQAQLAAALFQFGGATAARETTEKALALDANHPLANSVMARIELVSRESKNAEERLERTLNKENLHPQHLSLLAAIKLRYEDYDAAEELYQLGADTFPSDPDWLKSLAKVYLLAGNQDAKLRKTLEKLAPLEESNSVIRKKLATYAAGEKDWQTAVHWGQDAMYIDAHDPEIHTLLGGAFAGLGNYRKASLHYTHALLLDPSQPGWRFALADALVQDDRPAEARSVLKKLLEDHPDFPGADTLLESIEEEPKE